MPGERLIGEPSSCRRPPYAYQSAYQEGETDQPQVYIHGRWTASSRARKAECSWLTRKKSAESFPRLTCHGSRADRLVGDGVRGAGGPAGQQGQGVLGG